MSHLEIRKIFFDFFKERGHVIVPSSSLLPDDPSVLFTTAGMQQFKPYFLGKADPMKDFGSRRTTSIQKSMRTSDIDEVGDESHLTFFEMLGHFSFGDYFKKETVNWTYKFLTKELGIDKGRISATIFSGDKKIPFDEESYNAWAALLPNDKIKKGPREDNVWGPAGPEGPCGAANEVYVDNLEVATLVFMEFYCDKNQDLTPLSQKGVDVGWGFERIAMISQGKKNIFETDLFAPLIEKLPSSFSEKYKRIIADHIRALVFLISDGVLPSNKDQGYVLRRLIRRIIVHEYLAHLDGFSIKDVISFVIQMYDKIYPELQNSKIIGEFEKEKEKFNKTLKNGLKELEKAEYIDSATAFRLYESFGLPYEIIKEIGEQKAVDLKREDFDKEFKKHQEKSRAGAEKKFGGHGLLLNTGELKAGNEEELKKATKLHTATHLLQAALRKVLGDEIQQRGSDITAERFRFDFTFSRKLNPEELKKVQDLVNEAIEKDMDVIRGEMPYEEALKKGAMAFFKEKYPEIVSVYSITDKKTGEVFSRELCGGPHVKHTGEIGGIKIIKEESISSDIRRIRVVLK